MGKKIKDEELLIKMEESLKTDYYTFGAYTDYNGLDVKNIKTPIVEAIEKNNESGN